MNKKKPESTYHKSVLTNEVLYYLNPQPDKIYVDATFGGGGHTNAILEKEPNCTVIAIDWDEDALAKNQNLKEKYGDNLEVVWGNFAQLYKLLKKLPSIHDAKRRTQGERGPKIDGILADFGTSQFQIHQKDGFSFQTDTPLDMRMSPAHQKLTARDMLNNFTQSNLTQIFFQYGEEPKSKTIARAIVEYRKNEPFKTTLQLADLISSVKPSYAKASKGRPKGLRTHPATKVFQALRIVINKELENIESLLKSSISLLNEDGRMVFISFHSLEDRIVKFFFRENSHKLKILTPKAITATEEELAQNPSSRSAKLRAAIKTVKD